MSVENTTTILASPFAVPNVPCSKERCGAAGGGCQIVGCNAQRVKRERALAALPEPVLRAFEDGATDAVFRIDGDLSDAPMGYIAAAAVSGFCSALERGWKLVGPNGEQVRPYDLRMAVEGWQEKLKAEIEGADDDV